MSNAPFEADVVVIGSGFGGTMTALTIAHTRKPEASRVEWEKLRTMLADPAADPTTIDGQRRRVNERNAEDVAARTVPRIVILERGTWWTTPVPTVQDGTVATPAFLEKHNQPVQFWSALDHFKGVVDLLTRCLRRPGNEDGLYDLTHMGRRGFFGLFGQNDGVSVLRASGVGGGSLVYSNITVRPPEFIFDTNWATTWQQRDRDTYYELAKHAIGYGVSLAWDELNLRKNIPYQAGKLPDVRGATNAGLSNISARTARIDPHWETQPDPFLPVDSPRSVKRLGSDKRYWLDRARVFQEAIRAMRPDGFHTVDSSINDLTPERTPPYDPRVPPNHPLATGSINHCERQGRCTLGCLPGARHTLNKQLMAAAFGKPTDPIPVPQFPNIAIRALCEVDLIERVDGGYTVSYLERDHADPSRGTKRSITARRVIVAAGCLGTNELLLRCKDRGALPNLSARLGEHFSTNGDYIAFLDETKDPVNLTKGPVQTSVAHFNDREGDDHTQFHIVEDEGIPKALSSIVGFGVPLIRALANRSRLRVIVTLIGAIISRAVRNLLALFRNRRDRQEFFHSEEELTMNMMCVTASGRDQAQGKFALGKGWNETPLRLTPMNGVPFHKDPIFTTIDRTLNGKGGLAEQLVAPKDFGKRRFTNPFLSDAADALAAKSVTITHPLGGCCIGSAATNGVVDEYGRVFDGSASGGYYDGLYVADAAIIPAALGVNPSLTISALALRIGERIADDMMTRGF